MKTYRLFFKLTKHKDARGFESVVNVPDNADVQGIKEERAMYFEKVYHTPVKCVKIVEIERGKQ